MARAKENVQADWGGHGGNPSLRSGSAPRTRARLLQARDGVVRHGPEAAMPEHLSDPNVRTLIQVDVLLVVWLMTMGNYTALTRLRRKVYATPEDYAFKRVAPSGSPDDAVERSRRLHQNHLENVAPFLVLSLLYTLTRPAHDTLAWLLWGFLGARVLYTVFYLRAMQPYRTIAFAIGALIMFATAMLTLRATL
jgi:uncharacterized MAPEG superfamily protein